MGAWQITKKDLRLLTRDRRAFVVLLVFPLVFIAVLGIPAGRMLGWRDGNQVIEVVVVDESQSPESNRVIATLKSHPAVSPFRAADRADARRVLKHERCSVLIHFGRDFARKLGQSDAAALVDDQSNSITERLARIDVRIDEEVSKPNAAAVLADILWLAAIRATAEHPLDQTERAQPVVVKEPTASPERHSAGTVYQRLVPAYAVMFAFFLVNIMARSFITERELGTLQRLRMSPVSPAGLLTGKTLPFLIISVIQGVCLFVLGRYLFGMPWGHSPWLLLPVIVCTSMAATSLGLLIAAFVRTDSEVSAYGNFIVIAMAGISGCFMPRDWLPESMQTISLSLPHSWSLIAFDHILAPTMPSIVVVAQCCTALVGFASLFFIVGCWRIAKI